VNRHRLWNLALAFSMIAGGVLCINSTALPQSLSGNTENPGFSFKVELQQRSEMKSVVSPEGRDGKLVGSGDGSMLGPKVRGKLHWSNFEKVGETACQMNLVGYIETDDGARVDFESTGYALLANPPKWNTAGTMRFSTKDKRYEWLNGKLSAWHGEFDPDSLHAVMQSF